MKAYYSDTFVLPLPEGHHFPMAKYSRLRECLMTEKIVDQTDLHEAYLEALATALEAVLNRHRPDVVFYLAGADPYEGDRLGRLKLTVRGLRQRDEAVLSRCRRDRLPVVITMSGGYAHDVDAIVRIHATTILTAVSLWANASVS